MCNLALGIAMAGFPIMMLFLKMNIFMGALQVVNMKYEYLKTGAEKPTTSNDV